MLNTLKIESFLRCFIEIQPVKLLRVAHKGIPYIKIRIEDLHHPPLDPRLMTNL